MDALIETIKSRRSIRSYSMQVIPRDVLKTIIDAGNEAPSAMNSQPWRFVVVEDRETRKKLLRAALPKAQKAVETIKDVDAERYELIKKRYAELEDPIYYSAPAVVFVIGSGPYANQSCPLACENMMLAAHSMGLGSCWVGFGAMVTDDPEVRGILELKEGESIYGPILLGYPKGEPIRPLKKGSVVKWL